LKAPIRRVVTLDVPVPFSPRLEEFVSPSEARIAEAIRAVAR
jgi:pyruvate/2-oxoglutarate/acetoin dehydrogenase E1 component